MQPIDAHALKVIMRGLAARDFRRRHPRATEAAAWQHADRHAEAFREQALQFLTLLELERQIAAEAPLN